MQNAKLILQDIFCVVTFLRQALQLSATCFSALHPFYCAFHSRFQEYHKDNKNVLVEASDMKETVYIYKCENSVIQVTFCCG